MTYDSANLRDQPLNEPGTSDQSMVGDGPTGTTATVDEQVGRSNPPQSIADALAFLREQFQVEIDRLKSINRLKFAAYLEVGDASQKGHDDPAAVPRPRFYETLQGALGSLTHEVDILETFATRFAAA